MPGQGRDRAAASSADSSTDDAVLRWLHDLCENAPLATLLDERTNVTFELGRRPNDPILRAGFLRMVRGLIADRSLPERWKMAAQLFDMATHMPDLIRDLDPAEQAAFRDAARGR